MSHLSEADLAQFRRNLGQGTHPLKAIDKILKQKGPVYRSKWELNYSKVLEMEQKAGAIRSWRYEGLTFRLAKGQYHRIDFLIGHNDRSIELVQIKGRWHKNIRAGIKGLKWAAQLYPQFTWRIVTWTGTGWNGEYVAVE